MSRSCTHVILNDTVLASVDGDRRRHGRGGGGVGESRSHPHQDRIGLRARAGEAGRRERARSKVASAPLRGDAPWALSALPECLIQISKSTGSRELRAGASAAPAPCRLRRRRRWSTVIAPFRIAGDEAYVRRGTDRLRHSAPRAVLPRGRPACADSRDAREGAELRVYEPAQRGDGV